MICKASAFSSRGEFRRRGSGSKSEIQSHAWIETCFEPEAPAFKAGNPAMCASIV